MLDFFFRPIRSMIPGSLSGRMNAPAGAYARGDAVLVDATQPEDLSFWRAEDELAKLAALARES